MFFFLDSLHFSAAMVLENAIELEKQLQRGFNSCQKGQLLYKHEYF